jgi:hypothetical protein
MYVISEGPVVFVKIKVPAFKSESVIVVSIYYLMFLNALREGLIIDPLLLAPICLKGL